MPTLRQSFRPDLQPSQTGRLLQVIKGHGNACAPQFPDVLLRFAPMLLAVALAACSAQEPFAAGPLHPPIPHDASEPHAALDFPGVRKLRDNEVGVLAPGRPFETQDHARIVRDGLLAPHCESILARAQWRQDIVLASWAPAHFDNCRFRESQDYVRSMVTEAERAVAQGQPEELLAALGRALHGIQDFYSHTNYVELMAATHERFADVPIVKLWNPDGGTELDTLVQQGLVSGYVWWEPGEICKEPVLSHSAVNKDSASSSSGQTLISNWNLTAYRAAHELAVRATRAFLREHLGRPTWAALTADCENGVVFITSFDRRNQWGKQ